MSTSPHLHEVVQEIDPNRVRFEGELLERTKEAKVDSTLAEAFGSASMGRGGVVSYLIAFSKGHGAQPEGSCILLPSDFMEDFEDLSDMPCWDVRTWLSDGTLDPVEIAHIPLERFVHVASTAAILYSKILDPDFDPWPVIAGIHENCSLTAQKARVPDEVRDYLGREHFD